MSDYRKIDGPDMVDFARAIVQNIPTAADGKANANGLLAAYLLGKAVKGATKKR